MGYSNSNLFKFPAPPLPENWRRYSCSQMREERGCFWSHDGNSHFLQKGGCFIPKPSRFDIREWYFDPYLPIFIFRNVSFCPDLPIFKLGHDHVWWVLMVASKYTSFNQWGTIINIEYVHTFPESKNRGVILAWKSSHFSRKRGLFSCQNYPERGGLAKPENMSSAAYFPGVGGLGKLHRHKNYPRQSPSSPAPIPSTNWWS